PPADKDLRVRGTLASVDVQGGAYDVRVRPWVRRAGDHGEITVHTDAATTFEIGADTYTGAEGLAALAALDAGTMTVAFGRYDAATHAFTAATVQAGPSVGGADLDAVEGNVVARSGDLLTVRGGWALWRDRDAGFRRTVQVKLGPDTRVLKSGAPGAALDEAAISVGQRIVALGSFEEPSANAQESSEQPLVLDVTQGRVRLQLTHLDGTVKAVGAGQLELELRSIDRLGVELFDFSGTGTVPSADADPNDYEVAIGTLGLAGFAEGRWTRVLGFVAPFASAPPDFEAETVVSRPDPVAALTIGWGADGTTAPFVTMEPGSLVLDLANAAIGERHALRVGGDVLDLLDLAASPAIVPSGGRGVYAIGEPGHVEIFADFAEFVEALTGRLGGGQSARWLTAMGRYDGTANTLTVSNVAVLMEGAGAPQ
ncbi:MAG TPA: hypothetical protein VFV10_06160, partial [Gammaproteobacteria bacterium]|nr:hypothetical protein [Gammaproteobacteria bacterium]